MEETSGFFFSGFSCRATSAGLTLPVATMVSRESATWAKIGTYCGHWVVTILVAGVRAATTLGLSRMVHWVVNSSTKAASSKEVSVFIEQ